MIFCEFCYYFFYYCKIYFTKDFFKNISLYVKFKQSNETSNDICSVLPFHLFFIENIKVYYTLQVVTRGGSPGQEGGDITL